jgi:hypothetical protein
MSERDLADMITGSTMQQPLDLISDAATLNANQDRPAFGPLPGRAVGEVLRHARLTYFRRVVTAYLHDRRCLMEQ